MSEDNCEARRSLQRDNDVEQAEDDIVSAIVAASRRYLLTPGETVEILLRCASRCNKKTKATEWDKKEAERAND